MRATAFATVLSLLPAVVAQSGTGGEWADDTAAPGLGGRVFAFASWQGSTYAGGVPFAANGGVIGSLARWDGTAWRPVGSGVDLTTGFGPLPTATVRAMCEYQGDLIVAGTFDVAGGQARNNIARWDGSTFHALGQGLAEVGWDADVRGLAVFNNELYATGVFHQAGGAPVNGIARWNGAVWSPCGGGLLGGNATGHTLRVSGNRLIVGGDFTTAGGVAAACIAAWNGSSFSPLGAGLDARVDALAEYGGQLVAAGSFTFSGSTLLGGPAAWNGASWQPLGSSGPTFVTSLQVRGTELFAGGAFTQPGAYVCRFDGSTWSSFGSVTGVFGGTTGTLVHALALHGTGPDLLIGGEFLRGGSAPNGAAAVASCNVIAYDGAAWRQMGAGRGVNGSVSAIVPFRGDWLAIGAFDQIGGVAARGIARWDGDRWHHVVDCDGSVEHAVVWNGDLIASGTFTQLGGQPIQHMARWNGSTWSQFGPPILVPLAVHQGQLYSGGTSDLRRWNGSGWVIAASTGGGVVDRMHVHGDGNLYFTTAASGQHRIHRWNGTSLALIGVPNDLTTCLSSFGSDLIAGGRFTAIGGAPANLLAKWNGATWSTFGSGVTGFSVDSLRELDGALYAGTNGDPRGFLLRWNGAGWLAVPGALDGLPRQLFADAATSSLHAFGSFLSAAGKPAWNVAEWRTQERWRNRLHALPGIAGAPLLRGTGTLLPGSPWSYDVAAAPQHVGVLALGLSRIDAPLFGGTLVPSPDVLLVLVGDAAGRSAFASAWPANAPPGVQLLAQAWLLAAATPAGFAASNALECVAQ